MARIPTPEEVAAQQALALAADNQKLVEQQSQGKDFVNNGQGVIPEPVWKNLPGKAVKGNG